MYKQNILSCEQTVCANFPLAVWPQMLGKILWFWCLHRHQVLRITVKDEVQLSLVRDLEDMEQLQVGHDQDSLKNNSTESPWTITVVYGGGGSSSSSRSEI